MWLPALLTLSFLATSSYGVPQLRKQRQQKVQEQPYVEEQSALQLEEEVLSSAPEFKCPEDFGVYEDPEQCDAYYECAEGISTYKLCDDGLVFFGGRSKYSEQVCGEIYNVECGDRQYLQEPKGTDNCYRKYGKFAIEGECNKFFTCINDKATLHSCPGGLHFQEHTGTCTWPADVQRDDCHENTKLKLDDGWSCPDNINKVLESGQAVAHSVYPNPGDCQKFYICLNGDTPRHGGCALGEVFNAERGTCDFPENVPECAHFYDEHPAFADINAKGGPDFGDKRIRQQHDFQ